MAAPSEAWVGLVRAAQDAGFGRVQTKLTEEDFWLALSDHRWRASESMLISFPWSHLRGDRAMEYVDEVARMMKRYPPIEWGFRAKWIEWMFPLYYRLPPGPPAPKQLTVEASACPTFEALPTEKTLVLRDSKGQTRATSYATPSIVIEFDGARIPPLLRDMIRSILHDARMDRLAAELHAVEEMLAEYHAELARDLLAGGRRAMPKVVNLMLRSGLSCEQVARALRVMDEQDEEGEPDELEIRVAELLEQGRSP